MNFREWTRRERWHCYWEKGLEGIYNRAMEDVGECVLVGLMMAEKEAIVVWVGSCMGRLLLDIGSPLPLPLFHPEEFDTLYSS